MKLAIPTKEEAANKQAATTVTTASDKTTSNVLPVQSPISITLVLKKSALNKLSGLLSCSPADKSIPANEGVAVDKKPEKIQDENKSTKRRAAEDGSVEKPTKKPKSETPDKSSSASDKLNFDKPTSSTAKAASVKETKKSNHIEENNTNQSNSASTASVDNNVATKGQNGSTPNPKPNSNSNPTPTPAKTESKELIGNNSNTVVAPPHAVNNTSSKIVANVSLYNPSSNLTSPARKKRRKPDVNSDNAYNTNHNGSHDKTTILSDTQDSGVKSIETADGEEETITSSNAQVDAKFSANEAGIDNVKQDKVDVAALVNTETTNESDDKNATTPHSTNEDEDCTKAPGFDHSEEEEEKSHMEEQHVKVPQVLPAGEVDMNGWPLRRRQSIFGRLPRRYLPVKMHGSVNDIENIPNHFKRLGNMKLAEKNTSIWQLCSESKDEIKHAKLLRYSIGDISSHVNGEQRLVSILNVLKQKIAKLPAYKQQPKINNNSSNSGGMEVEVALADNENYNSDDATMAFADSKDMDKEMVAITDEILETSDAVINLSNNTQKLLKRIIAHSPRLKEMVEVYITAPNSHTVTKSHFYPFVEEIEDP